MKRWTAEQERGGREWLRADNQRREMARYGQQQRDAMLDAAASVRCARIGLNRDQWAYAMRGAK